MSASVAGLADSYESRMAARTAQLAEVPAPRCLACEDTRWEQVTGADGVPRVRRCEKCRGVNDSGCCRDCPDPLKNAVLGNYQADEGNQVALAAARAWLAAPAGDIYLHGGVGVGKTRLCVSLLNECVGRGKSARFVRVPLLLDRLRVAMGGDQGGEVESQLLNNFFTVPVLGMDDLGADKGSDYGRRVVQTILDQRLDKGLRTVWTSNLSLADIAEFYGDDRLASRISGSAVIAEVGGRDRRVR